MGNDDVANLLDDIGDMLEIQSENLFKVRAYHRAANSIRSLSDDINKICEAGKLSEIPTIGSGLAEKIDELLKTGKLAYYEELKERVPPSLLELMRVPTVGPKKAKQLYDELQITSIGELQEAAEKGLLRSLPRMSTKTEENILHGIELLQKYRERILLYEAFPIAERIAQELRAQSFVEQADLAGSLRRMKETIGDIDILASSTQPEKVADFFCHLPEVSRVLAKGETKSSVLIKTGLQIDLRVVSPEEYGSALQYFTGSKEHSIHLRDIAKKCGLKISEYGIFKVSTNEKLGGKTEEQIYERLGMDFIPPTLRENKGEIEAALEHKLPRLIELGDIKGDLHVHSRWSDGLSKIEEIAAKARELAYQYTGICDHAERLKVAHGLSVKEIAARNKEIEKLNEELNGLTILSCIELNVDNDGNVDYKPEVLKSFDIVIASIHGGFNQPREQLTRRTLTAMNNKDVDIIGHPTGRILGKRPPYEIDLSVIFREAKNTGTFLELNSFPDRLDLRDDYLREAKEQGAKIAICTDAHIASQLPFISYGVATAQRGWLTKDDVINTLPLEKLRKMLK